SALELALKDAGRKTLNLQELSLAAKMPLKAAEDGLKALEARLLRFDPNRFMHTAAFEGVMDHLAVLVENFHIKNPLRAGMASAPPRSRRPSARPASTRPAWKSSRRSCRSTARTGCSACSACWSTEG